MMLVVALPDLATRLSRILLGARYVVRLDGDDGSELRHQIHLYQPDVVILDWRMGGSRWRAVDEVPAIVSRTMSRPHVIALLPKASAEVEQAAADRGCYDAIAVTDPYLDQELREAVEAALLDRARQVPDHRRVSRADLH